MNIHLIALPGTSPSLLDTLEGELPYYSGCTCRRSMFTQAGSLRELFRVSFDAKEPIVAIMATGIVNRMIAPLMRNKLADPAVVALDDQARWAISVLSGHEGGANRLAYQVAAACGAEAVVSTGTDTNKRYSLGIGCRKGISPEAVEVAIQRGLETATLKLADLRHAASIDIKRNEDGLVQALRRLDLPLFFIKPERIVTQSRSQGSGQNQQVSAAQRHIGVPAVAEPCALLAAGRSRLVLPRQAYKGVTVAIAEEEQRWPDTSL